MEKIKSGVIGLNALLNGGVNKNSITLVVGAPGVGKTTMALQFIRRGLEEGSDALFVSLDENQEQIIHEAEEMGWSNIRSYIEEGKLVFIDAGGKKFSDFVRSELPVFVEQWKGSDTRIVIDPLTPVIWALTEPYEQRELLMLLFKEVKKIGTIMCTLEEHGFRGDLSGPETIIPMYLADTVIHLKYVVDGGLRKRQMHILKSRNSRHSHRFHPYAIVKEFGLIIHTGEDFPVDVSKPPSAYIAELDRSLSKLPPFAAERLRRALPQLSRIDFSDIDISKMIDGLLDEYKQK